MKEKVQQLLNRLPAVEEELGNPDSVQDQSKYRKLTQEHSYLSSLKQSWEEFTKAKHDFEENEELLKSETDEEFCQAVREDQEKLSSLIDRLEQKIESLLIPPDPNDSRSTIMEIRAGTGGDEAALFVGNCVRMYQLFADSMGWKTETLSLSPSDAGGYKDYVMVVSGTDVHRFLQFEGGTHRVQRVPETETQGRVHTSAVTVAILMEPDEEEEIDIDEKDIRIDTYRASGAGGQHVNTTDSAVRITHIPTGVVAWCQQEKSQHKNKEKAMRQLKARIVEAERQKKEAEMASKRSSQVGSGDRSERIRTYNFPQNRLTDHRIGYTRHHLDGVMQGDLTELCQALIAHFRNKKLNEND